MPFVTPLTFGGKAWGSFKLNTGPRVLSILPLWHRIHFSVLWLCPLLIIFFTTENLILLKGVSRKRWRTQGEFGNRTPHSSKMRSLRLLKIGAHASTIKVLHTPLLECRLWLPLLSAILSLMFTSSLRHRSHLFKLWLEYIFTVEEYQTFNLEQRCFNSFYVYQEACKHADIIPSHTLVKRCLVSLFVY